MIAPCARDYDFLIGRWLTGLVYVNIDADSDALRLCGDEVGRREREKRRERTERLNTECVAARRA